MDKKKIRRIIAREGLILLGVAIILYIALLLIPDLGIPLMKYKLELFDGRIHYLTITPEIEAGENVYSESFFKKLSNPTYSLILKRLNEYEKREGVTIIKADPYKSWSAHILKPLIYFLKFSFLLKVIIIFCFLFLIRFIIWALRTLREK